MKKLTLALALLLFTGMAFAQSNLDDSHALHATSKRTTTTLREDTSGYRNYIGLSGGYLLKNKSIFNNPIWYLSDGQFVELNLGTRGKVFGWSAAIGYLKLNRSAGKWGQLPIHTQMMYDSSIGGTKPGTVIFGLDVDNMYIETGGQQDSSAAKPFRGFYVLTGPNVWIGNGKLKLNLAVEGGIGLVQPGYYYVSGFAKEAKGAAVLEAEDLTGAPVDYEVSAAGLRYTQYAMSEKYFDKVTSGNGFSEKEPREITPIVRATANIEYFVRPRISIHGGANLWYLFSPKMKGQQELLGERAGYLNTATQKPDYGHGFSYSQPFAQKNIMNGSANIGVKYWFGLSGSTKKEVTTEQSTTEYERLKQQKENRAGEQKEKAVRITVVDKLTKTPLGGVTVTLENQDNQGVITATTQQNGTITLEDVRPGNYTVTGEIYEIPTTRSDIRSDAFAGAASPVQTTLFYEDPRFILKGVAVNTENGEVESDVKVSLEKGREKAAKTRTNADGNFHFLLQTNSDYQIQGLKNGYYSNTVEASTKGLKRSQTLFVKLKLGMNTIEVGKSFVVNNIHYDFDDASIRPDAALELDRLAAFLNENPKVRIELSSHTDSRGSAGYNRKLSQGRAQSAVDYLIAKGVKSHRLIAKGYGETKLVNGCKEGVPCTEAEHQANRRTEIKIIQ